jgi:DNA-binding transcriptional ArsR family regulator
VQQIHFTIDDLARTRVVTAQNPTLESLLALGLLQRGGGGPFFARWRQDIRRRYGPRLDDLIKQTASVKLTPALLFGDVRSIDGSGAPLDAALPLEAADALREFYRGALLPHWSSITWLLGLDRDVRNRVIANGGVEQLLLSLDPRMRWSSPTLRTAGPGDSEIRLPGRGLLLVPSLFLAERPAMFIDSQHRDVPPVLVYPTPFDVPAASTLWRRIRSDNEALHALIGRTRAAMMRALEGGSNTSDLGRAVGISAPAASQHTAVLRKAGLITTRRQQKSVLHTLTPLGTALLRGAGPAAEELDER